MTKIDKEIQEGLYDPKKKTRGTLKIFGTKQKVRRLKRHLEKEHPSTKGHMRVNDPAPRGQKQSIVSETQRRAMFAEIGRRASRKRWRRLMKRNPVTRRFDPDTIPPRWYEAMVKGIKKGSDVRNPYAIVKSIWAQLSPQKQAEIRRREAKGEVFRYDLPLPEDYVTHGTGTLRTVKPFNLAEVQVNLSVRDYLNALKSGIFSRMKRNDGTTALVARCKSEEKNVNIFVDKVKS